MVAGVRGAWGHCGAQRSPAGLFRSLGDIWRSLETPLVVTILRSSWHLVSEPGVPLTIPQCTAALQSKEQRGGQAGRWAGPWEVSRAVKPGRRFASGFCFSLGPNGVFCLLEGNSPPSQPGGFSVADGR